jgi:hypothetical protein
VADRGNRWTNFVTMKVEYHELPPENRVHEFLPQRPGALEMYRKLRHGGDDQATAMSKVTISYLARLIVRR